MGALAVRAAQVALGVLLLASGTLKMRSRAWPRQAAEFGAAPWVARVLPWVELVLGALLVVGSGAPWTSLTALGLLLVFTGTIVRRLSQGRPVPCGCFGELRARPVGPHTLVRNAGLVVLAVISALPA
jgi:uncharacterized membrane protein YphA (DoxX/SURF4 family)